VTPMSGLASSAFGGLDVVVGEFQRPASGAAGARAAARPAWVRSRIRLRSNSAGAKDVKDQPPLRGRRVEGFGQAAKPDTPYPQG
jgi:hypothetical protein